MASEGTTFAPGTTAPPGTTYPPGSPFPPGTTVPPGTTYPPLSLLQNGTAGDILGEIASDLPGVGVDSGFGDIALGNISAEPVFLDAPIRPYNKVSVISFALLAQSRV